jgi:integrase
MPPKLMPNMSLEQQITGTRRAISTLRQRKGGPTWLIPSRRFPAVKSSGPGDLVFASVAKGAPMRDNTILTRFIKPAARKLGIGWVNWQVLRRSHATWLKLASADVKDAQAQLRHSRATTTLDIYQQFIPASQRRAVDRLMDLKGTTFVN